MMFIISPPRNSRTCRNKPYGLSKAAYMHKLSITLCLSIDSMHSPIVCAVLCSKSSFRSNSAISERLFSICGALEMSLYFSNAALYLLSCACTLCKNELRTFQVALNYSSSVPASMKSAPLQEDYDDEVADATADDDLGSRADCLRLRLL